MRAECVKAIQMAAQEIGKTMTVADMRGIENKIYEARKQLAIKDTETYIGWTREKQIEEAGKVVVQEALHSAIKKRQRAEIAVIKEAERNTSITHAMASYGIDRMKALARFTMAMADGKGGVISLESHMKGLAAYYQGKLTELRKLRTDGAFSALVTNKQNMLDYIKETFGIDSGNAQAKKAWQQTSKVLNEMIDHFNSKGGDIAKNINWHNPQRHDALRVLKAGEKAFVDEHMNLVDRTKYVTPDGSLMDDAQMRKFLKEAFLTISTDGANKPVIPGGNAGTVANRMKAHRQMHYKSPEAYITAMEKFGAGNPFDMLDSHIDGMARNIALAEKFGPNAIFEFNKEYRRAVEETGGTTDSSLKSTFERMSGQRHTENVAMAAKFQAVRDAMVATKLGSMLFAQLVDTATMKMTARAMGIPMREVMAWAYRIARDKELGDLLKLHGYGLETALNESARWADNTSGNGFWGKAAHTVTVIQGAHAWTKWTRQAFAAAMEAKMGELTAKYDSIAKLPELDRKILESKGVTEADWQVWRLAKPTEYKGLKILGPDAIEAIPASKIAEIVPEIRQAIEAQAKVLEARMAEQSAKEAGWVAGRQKKLDDYRAKLEKMMGEYEATREARKEKVAGIYLERSGELFSRIEQAEIGLEIATAANREKSVSRTARFMEDVKRGMENYGRRRSETGERLGAARHSAKLQQASFDRAYVRESEAIAAKATTLFGPERVEDGLKLVGKVTKAAAELDAYRAKMEERIGRYSDKKDGGPTVERAQRLLGQAEQEFAAARQAADAAMTDLRQMAAGKQAELSGLWDAVQGKIERAGAEADIAAYLATEKSEANIQSMLDTLEFRLSEQTGRMMSKGERLGYRKAMVDYKVREMARREELYAKQAGREVFAKATDFEKRIDAKLKGLETFRADAEARAARRDAIVQDFQDAVESKVQEESADFRRETAIKMVSMNLEETHMAVLQPSERQSFDIKRGNVASELGGLILQFKSFPWAFLRQHILERAEFVAGRDNPWVYRVKLFAAATVMGGVVVMMNDIASGKDPQDIIGDPEDPDYKKKMGKFVMKAMLKGGGIGILDELFKGVMEAGENPWRAAGSFLGPAGSYAAGKVLPTAFHGGMALATQDEEEIQKFGKYAYDSAVGITPGQNLWFLKGLLHNVLLHEMHEMANPGYAQRNKERLNRESGQEYWLGMGEETRLPKVGD